MNIEETERRVWNWARWSASDGGGARKCASAERNYRPVRPDEEEAARGTNPIDVLDAELVEKAITQLQQRWMRVLLISRYLYRIPNGKIARDLGLSRQAGWSEMLEAKRLATLGALTFRLEEIDEAAAALRKPLAIGKLAAYKVDPIAAS